MNSPESGALAGKNRLTAGQALSERREKLGLTIEECAEALKLSVSKMKAIEADNEAPFPSETFLRGYLKNYAKLVDLPADDILYYFDAQRQEQVSDVEDGHSGPIQKHNIKGLPYLFAIIVVLLWFAVSHQHDLLTYWKTFQTQGDTGAMELEEENASSFAVAKEKAEEERASPSVLLLPDDESGDADISQSDGLLNEDLLQELNNTIDTDVINGSKLESNSESNQSDSVEQGDAIDALLLPATSDTKVFNNELNLDRNNPSSVNVTGRVEPLATQRVERITADNIENNAIDASTINSSAELPSLSVEPSLIKDLLHFTFLEECWVEVIDATNRKIVSSIRKANTKLQVEGRSPFSITLGNINGTTLRFNDEAVALVNSADGRTLRLTVGG
ncbi:RodZ domain-containing protein [Eionea flava]